MTFPNKEDYINYRINNAFNQKFIKTHIISKQSGITFNKLYDMRTKGDYNDFFEFDDANVMILFEPVEKLLNEINDFLSQ